MSFLCGTRGLYPRNFYIYFSISVKVDDGFRHVHIVILQVHALQFWKFLGRFAEEGHLFVFEVVVGEDEGCHVGQGGETGDIGAEIAAVQVVATDVEGLKKRHSRQHGAEGVGGGLVQRNRALYHESQVQLSKGGTETLRGVSELHRRLGENGVASDVQTLQVIQQGKTHEEVLAGGTRCDIVVADIQFFKVSQCEADVDNGCEGRPADG